MTDPANAPMEAVPRCANACAPIEFVQLLLLLRSVDLQDGSCRVRADARSGLSQMRATVWGPVARALFALPAVLLIPFPHRSDAPPESKQGA